MTILDDLRRAGGVLFAHAHPDDETLSTGALILDLVDHGVEAQVVTATRGERGEVVPGSLPAGFAGDVEEHRAVELAGALAALGVRRHAFLGTPPAAAGGRRTYRDSGMRWVRDGLAGPAGDAGPDAFSVASAEDAAADLGVLLRTWRPDALVSYDIGGTYGHPDHVRLHHVAAHAAAVAGVRFVTVATERADASEWHDLPELRDRLRGVLTAYRTQLTVDGDEIVHVGGQRQPIETWFGLASPGVTA